MATVSSFKTVLSRLSIPPSSEVCVAVSGGSDSIALTYLAKQVFKRVLAVTVDHNLREGSHAEALKAKKIVENLGVEHKLIKINWPKGVLPSPGKTQSMCRNKRFNTLFGVCRDNNIRILMTGHHWDDQIETVLYRIARFSRLDGLAGILPVQRFLNMPGIRVCRPLLDFRKESLVEFCKENKLEWVEDPTNSQPVNCRNVIRHFLKDYPELSQGIGHIRETCFDFKMKLHDEVLIAINKGVKVDKTYGYVMIYYDTFNTLSRPAAMKLLHVIFKYVTGGYTKPISTKSFNILWKLFKGGVLSTSARLQLCIIIKMPKKTSKYFCIARHSQDDRQKIKVGETMHWNKQFLITLLPLDNRFQSASPEEFMVRPWQKNDDHKAKMGVRKISAYKLPPVLTRPSLPVIVDKNGKIVLIPHFRYIDKSYGVTCTCRFEPVLELKEWVGSTFSYQQ